MTEVTGESKTRLIDKTISLTFVYCDMTSSRIGISQTNDRTIPEYSAFDLYLSRYFDNFPTKAIRFFLLIGIAYSIVGIYATTPGCNDDASSAVVLNILLTNLADLCSLRSKYDKTSMTTSNTSNAWRPSALLLEPVHTFINNYKSNNTRQNMSVSVVG